MSVDTLSRRLRLNTDYIHVLLFSALVVANNEIKKVSYLVS